MRLRLRSIIAGGVFCLAAAVPACAATPAEELESQIAEMLGKLEVFSNGVVKWEGADRLDARQDGEATIAEAVNARISIGLPDAKPGGARARLDFDRVALRSAPATGGATALAIALPARSVFHGEDGDEIRLSLGGAAFDVLFDKQSGRIRQSSLAFTEARIDDKNSGAWIKFGPLAASTKIVGNTDGGWNGPIDFDLKAIEFLSTEGPVGGQIDRITYTARAAGPDLAALDRMRDRLDALREKPDQSPEARLDALLDLLPDLMPLFSLTQGELAIEGIVAHAGLGEPLVELDKASIGGALTGLSGEAAALRITFKQQGLQLAPVVLDPAQVPQRVVLDVGLEDIGTSAMRTMLEAAKAMRPGADDAAKDRATQQIIGAAALLTPVFRIHDLALDLPAAGFDATGEASGSPLSPKGYKAEVDVVVRGFDALPGLAGDTPLAPYLPVLKEIGTSAAALDGSPRLKFHLASAPGKLITINGSDVGAWVAGEDPADQPRRLRPADPPLSGADVRAAQRALNASRIAAPQNGAYDGATAAAVARFQKQQGLNVDGVVDAATRQKLGVKPEPAGPKPEPPRPSPLPRPR